MRNIYFSILFLFLSQQAFSQNCCGSFSQNASNNGDSTATFGVASGNLDGDGYVDIYLGNFSSSSGDKIFIQDPAANVNINPVGNFCVTDSSYMLTASDTGGIWSGNGITDTVNGIFDPGVAGVGIHQITYTLNDSCGTTGTIDIQVLSLDNSPSNGSSFSGKVSGVINKYPELSTFLFAFNAGLK